MSGGSFGYAYSRVQDFAEELERKLNTEADFTLETIATLRDVLMLATVAAKVMKEAEWLYSGDNGEQSFMRNVAKIGEEFQ